MALTICRICLTSDMKTCTTVNTRLQDIYERITGYKWARDNRPVTICYICKSQLRRSLKLQQMSKLSEETFDQIHAVSFEFTEEILPILYKRRLQTLTTAPISNMIIEPKEDTEIKEEISEIKETGTHKIRFKTFSINPVIIACVGNEESSSISGPQKLGISPLENNTFINVNYVNNGYDADKIKDIKTEDDSNTEGPPVKILKMDTNQNDFKKQGIKTEFQENHPFDNDFYKSSLNKTAFVYLPSPINTDFSSEEDYKFNDKHKTKDDIKIFKNVCNVLSSTANQNSPRKSITLTYKQNDIIHSRMSLEKNAKPKKVIQKSPKRNGEIKVPYKKDCMNFHDKLFTKKREDKENKYTCDICNRSFYLKSHLSLHMKKHSGNRQLKCEKCLKTDTCLHNVNGDKLSYKKPKKFICKTCQKSFKQWNHLDQHIRTHTGKRPYSCKICNKRFIQLSHLLQHNRVHSGEKPYSCICGKSFTQQSGLMHHRMTHMRVKPFTCGICASGFNQKINLHKHLRNAHGLSTTALKSPKQKHPAENAPPK